MPLAPGSNKDVISHNIGEMVAAGRPQDQAIAAALSNARKYALGGLIGEMPKSAKRILHPAGLINSKTPGRTDRLKISVPNHAHIIPADVVSGLGQGNTAAGGAILDKMLHSGPYGLPGHANGGGVGSDPVDIIAAGGEYVVYPHQVAAQGEGDMSKGHDRLDKMIKKVRSHTAARLKTLPGPKK